LKLLNKTLKYGVTTSFLIGTLLFTGCSSKQSTYSGGGVPADITPVYKQTNNTKIRNSKAMHRATLRPYTVFGVRYYPKVENMGAELRGIASWYGPNFHAKKTSNGEVYNMYAMTAAHKTLPMNTMVRVDNLENGRSAIVRINDRGPFVAGRIIDLSNKAAHKIDMVKKGTVQVKVTVIGYNGEIENGNAPVNEMPYNQNTAVANNNLGSKVNTYKNPEPVQVIEPMKIEETTIAESQSIAKPKPVVAAGNYNIQVGAFGRLEGAMQTKAKYESLTNGKYNISVKKVLSGERYLHKVYIEGFDSYNHAQLFKDSNSLNGMILER